MDWTEVARRQEERSESAQGPVLRGNAAYGAGLAHLMLGGRDAARVWLDRAVEAYRESWADAPPESWGRPIAGMKSRLLVAEPAEAEARWALDAGADTAASPIGRYAAALAHLVLGEDEQARAHADAIRTRDDFPAAVGDALAALASPDPIAYVEAVEAVLESFETRSDYLEDVAVADTVLVLQALAEPRGLRAELSSPLLPQLASRAMSFGLYLLFLVPPLLLGLFVQSWLKRTFARFSAVPLSTGLNGASVARTILDRNSLEEVPVGESRGGPLTDHYDPRKRAVFLSPPVYEPASVAAAAVAAHETGHALQHQAGYVPMSLRSKMFPVVAFASSAWIWLLLAGALLGALNLVAVALLLYAVAVLFHIVTLPVEFNASRRASAQLAGLGLVTAGEREGVEKVLKAAALTYRRRRSSRRSRSSSTTRSSSSATATSHVTTLGAT